MRITDGDAFRDTETGREVTLEEMYQAFVIPSDLFTGACTCRPIFAEGGLIVAGEDNCPVHGFSDDD